MNYVLNFCRITSASRIFSRNFYLPLLKPTTPKDAMRTFRITGKWLLGSKTQHYIPVLLNHEEKRHLDERRRKKCNKRRTIAKKQRNRYVKNDKVKHCQSTRINKQEDLTTPVYVTPDDKEIVKQQDADVQSQQYENVKPQDDVKLEEEELHELMDDYIYMMPRFDHENESHRLLLNILNTKENPPGFFVYTVDDKRCNVVLTGQFERALRDGDVIDVMVSQRNDKLLIKLKNFKKVPLELDRFDMTMNGNDLFSGEGATSLEEEKFHHHGKFIMSIAKIFEDKEREAEEWELELRRIVEKRIKRAFEATKEYNDILSSNTNALNWRKYEKDCKKVVDQISEPIVEHHIGMIVEDFDKTKDVAKIIERGKLLHCLPTIAEIPDVVNSMSNAKYHELITEFNDDNEVKERRLSGVQLFLPNGKERFVTGQMIVTDDGDVFVPGQTIVNEFGTEYAPGITVNLNDQVTLVNGLIVGEENNERPMFCPTDSTITDNGQLTFATTKEERVKYKPIRAPPKLNNNTSVQEQPEEEPIKKQKTNDTAQNTTGKKKKVIKKKLKKEKVKKEKVKKEEVLNEYEMDPFFETILFVDEAKEPEEVEEKNDTNRDSSSLSRDLRQELEQLRKELLDDGLEEIVANLEEKSSSLRQKLEELRKIKIKCLEDTHVTYVNVQIAQEHAKILLDNVRLRNISNTNDDTIVNVLTETLLDLTRRCVNLRNRKSIKRANISNNTDRKAEDVYLKTILKESIVEANEILKKYPKDQVMTLKTICNVLETKLHERDVIERLNQTCANSYDRTETIELLMNELTADLNENKYELYRCLLSDVIDSSFVDKIGKILIRNGGDLMVDALRRLTKTNDFNSDILLKKIVNGLKRKKIDRLKTESEIVDHLQITIATIIKGIIDDLFVKLTSDSMALMHDYLAEASALSLLLERHDVQENLATISDRLNEGQSLSRALSNNTGSTLEFIKRVVLIRKLSFDDVQRTRAIERMKRQPECVKNETRIREMIRESAILLSDNTVTPLNNSRDVPIKYLKDDNPLAIEDFLLRRRIYGRPLMICKKGLQAIVPYETSRAVLSGRVKYVLIDENGRGTVKPIHSLDALKMTKNYSETTPQSKTTNYRTTQDDFVKRLTKSRNLA